ncbi:MAG: hypothetical protein QW746_04935 [Thermoplasmata archaeon]
MNRKNVFLEHRDSLPYEDLLSENDVICDVYFNDGKYYTINGFEVNISVDKLFIMRKIGKVVEKTIIPLANVLAIKQYCLMYYGRKEEDIKEDEKVEEIIQEIDEVEDGKIWLPGRKGREIAKKQFQKAVKMKDRDIIKKEELDIREEEKQEEKKLVVTGQDLLEGKI